MTSTELILIKKQLERIKKKIDSNFKDQFLSINEVSKLVSLSLSIIRRTAIKGKLKCSRKFGSYCFRSLK